MKIQKCTLFLSVSLSLKLPNTDDSASLLKKVIVKHDPIGVKGCKVRVKAKVKHQRLPSLCSRSSSESYMCQLRRSLARKIHAKFCYKAVRIMNSEQFETEVYVKTTTKAPAIKKTIYDND